MRAIDCQAAILCEEVLLAQLLVREQPVALAKAERDCEARLDVRGVSNVHLPGVTGLQVD